MIATAGCLFECSRGCCFDSREKGVRGEDAVVACRETTTGGSLCRFGFGSPRLCTLDCGFSLLYSLCVPRSFQICRSARAVAFPLLLLLLPPSSASLILTLVFSPPSCSRFLSLGLASTSSYFLHPTIWITDSLILAFGISRTSFSSSPPPPPLSLPHPPRAFCCEINRNNAGNEPPISCRLRPYSA